MLPIEHSVGPILFVADLEPGRQKESFTLREKLPPNSLWTLDWLTWVEESGAMSTSLCGHFSLEVELLPVTHTSVVLRVPIRRCALAERMISIIRQDEE